MLTGSLPAGNYVVSVHASSTQPASEQIHLVLLRRSLAGDDTQLAADDVTLTTDASSSGTAQLSLAAPAVDPDCGEALVIRASLPSGEQTLYFVQIALDLP